MKGFGMIRDMTRQEREKNIIHDPQSRLWFSFLAPHKKLRKIVLNSAEKKSSEEGVLNAYCIITSEWWWWWYHHETGRRRDDNNTIEMLRKTEGSPRNHPSPSFAIAISFIQLNHRSLLLSPSSLGCWGIFLKKWNKKSASKKSERGREGKAIYLYSIFNGCEGGGGVGGWAVSFSVPQRPHGSLCVSVSPWGFLAPCHGAREEDGEEIKWFGR